MDDTPEKDLQRFWSLVRGGSLTTLAPLLPLLFTFNGKPFTLKNHFVFEPLFTTVMPQHLVVRAARQVGKTLSVAARALILAATINYFRILVVAPTKDQVLRVSNDSLRPLIEGSPFRNIWFHGDDVGSVTRRELRNQSLIYFSYAFLSSERIRGYSGCRALFLDEVQDLSVDHLPIIYETLSAAEEFTTIEYTGTSKTRDNTLQWLWEKSSQAEWIMRCHHGGCGEWNIPAVHDEGGQLEKMLGPYRDDISSDAPGLVCWKCQKPLQPRTGSWVHRYTQKAGDFAGYHISQPIVPAHYAYPAKWRMLLGKQSGSSGYTTAKFYNEVLGTSYDLSTKLINEPDLKRAAVLHDNTEAAALVAAGAYQQRVLAVDWGGGGADGVSFTVVTVIGMTPSGVVDVIFGKKLLTPHDFTAEAVECLRLFNVFQCGIFAHDYTGAGELREAIMVHNGLPEDRLMPISYIGTKTGNVINYKPPTAQHPRAYWTVDKTRILQLVCYAIKFNRVRFFRWDWQSTEEPGLISDFLALQEMKIPTARGSDLYTIQRDPHRSDDTAQSVAVGCAAIWHMTQTWPSFSGIEQAAALHAEAAAYEDTDF